MSLKKQKRLTLNFVTKFTSIINDAIEIIESNKKAIYEELLPILQI